MKIIKDKALSKDLAHLVEFVHTTSLKVPHSLYLRYLPELTHFSHQEMKDGTMLAALRLMSIDPSQVCCYSHYRGTVLENVKETKFACS